MACLRCSLYWHLKSYVLEIPLMSDKLGRLVILALRVKQVRLLVDPASLSG